MLPGITGGMVMTGMPDEHGQRPVAWPVYRPGSPPRTGQPVQSDLKVAAKAFGTQAAAFTSIMPAGGPASVDGGDPELDQALTRILELIGSLHAQLAVTAEVLAAVVVQAAAIIDGLAVDLAAIENALEEEAYVASRYGVTIGTDGQPPPVPPEPDIDLSGRHWLLAYKLAHERAMADVQQARQQAVRQLTRLYEQVMPSRRLAMSSAGAEILTSSLRGPRMLSRVACLFVVRDV